MHTRQIPVDLNDLAAAFEDASDTVRYYLDLETGAVIAITDEVRYELEAVDEELEDAPEAEGDRFAQALQERDLPEEWMRAMVQEAFVVEQGYGTRYIAIPTADTHAAYRTMEAFIETVAELRLQATLLRSIQGRGAFRRFKDVLLAHPDERESWFAFSAERLRERALAWLAAEGVEAVIDREQGEGG